MDQIVARNNSNEGLEQTFIQMEVKPFVKWAGGKQQLITQFEEYLPQHINRYFEPFVGGGAIFFHLWNTGRVPNEVFLFDNNKELINTYQVIRDEVDQLIELLAIHQNHHNRDYYYKIRALDRKDIALNPVERAARTIYLNRTCYNGLYRVNQKGQFNVPMGRYENPRILHEDTLCVANSALQGVNIGVDDFECVLEYARVGDFFYFDPPYDPLSKTASFTSYTAGNFRDGDQQRLADAFRQLTKMGCICMLSNSYTPLILDLYQDFRIETVYATRVINSDANGRGNIKEVVVLNY